jgi:hypothetical protein
VPCIRRFLIHILPNSFHRIRHFGLLAGAGRKDTLIRVRDLLGAEASAVADATDLLRVDPSRAGMRDFMPGPRAPRGRCTRFSYLSGVTLQIMISSLLRSD